MRNTTRQTRENRTITVDFRSEATYFQLLGNGKAFLECVLAFVMSLGLQLKHKAAPEEVEKFCTLTRPPQWSNDVRPLDDPPLLDMWSAARLPNATSR